jgi:Ca2+/Na+ antiporter
LICKQNIVDVAEAQGSFYVIDLVSGTSASIEAEQLRADFKIFLGVEDLSTVTVDELLNVIDPECPVARLALNKSSKMISSEIEMTPVAQEDSEAQLNKDDEKRQKLIKNAMMNRDPSWTEQFKLAVMVEDEMTGFEAFCHFLTMPWKILFAAIPTRSFLNGWATLVCTAVAICALTYVMTEVMMFMGYLLDFRGCILALIMVSVGTSMNNLKSSMKSAASNKSADDVFLPTVASNAANIFVGLGLPWTIATIYRYANDQGSLVIGQMEAFDINFAVVTFLCCAFVTALVLGLRRSCLGGELGGPVFSKYFSSFMMTFLWTIFIVLNCLNCYGYFGATFMPESIQGLSASQLDLPAPMIKACQTSNTDTCGVRMTWNPSSGLQSSSMRYRLEVMDRYSAFHPLSQLCGVQGGQMDCEVPMETFADAPFFLEEGTPILVRASAFINNSWGNPSQVDYNGARMIGAPGRMTQVRASSVTDSTVMLTWDAVDGMAYNDKYEIYFSQTGGLGDYIYWTAVSTTSFEVQNLYPNMSYYFRIRGKNACGVCAFSEPLKIVTTATRDVQAATVAAVQQIRVDAEANCSVKITWNRPADCDPDTTNYRVTVQTNTGAMGLLHQCGNNGSYLECMVPLTDLSAFSFGLSANDLIIAQVQACSTITGNCGVQSMKSTEQVRMLA